MNSQHSIFDIDIRKILEEILLTHELYQPIHGGSMYAAIKLHFNPTPEQLDWLDDYMDYALDLVWDKVNEHNTSFRDYVVSYDVDDVFTNGAYIINLNLSRHTIMTALESDEDLSNFFNLKQLQGWLSYREHVMKIENPAPYYLNKKYYQGVDKQ